MEFVPCWNMVIVGISLLFYLVYFNAPIYLVKGGRLSLMPGVLFRSYCPSFRHTGVMFLDFEFLTRLGVMGTRGSPGLGGARIAGLYLRPDSWTMKIQD